MVNYFERNPKRILIDLRNTEILQRVAKIDENEFSLQKPLLSSLPVK